MLLSTKIRITSDHNCLVQRAKAKEYNPLSWRERSGFGASHGPISQRDPYDVYIGHRTMNPNLLLITDRADLARLQAQMLVHSGIKVSVLNRTIAINKMGAA